MEEETTDEDMDTPEYSHRLITPKITEYISQGSKLVYSHKDVCMYMSVTLQPSHVVQGLVYVHVSHYTCA